MGRFCCLLALPALSAVCLVGCSKVPEYNDCTITATVDQDNDGTTDYTTDLAWDAEGHLTGVASELLTYDPPVTAEFTYVYDSGAYPSKATVVTWDGEKTTNGSVTLTYSPDDGDQLTKLVLDNNDDGIPESVTSYTWSDDGKTITGEQDFTGDGAADVITTYVYYDYPYSFTIGVPGSTSLPLLAVSTDTDANGTTDVTYTNTFNDDGFLVTTLVHYEAGDKPDLTDTFTYDENHNLLKVVRTTNDGFIVGTARLAGTCYP